MTKRCAISRSVLALPSSGMTIRGRPQTVAPDVLRQILDALGLPCVTRTICWPAAGCWTPFHYARTAAADHGDRSDVQRVSMSARANRSQPASSLKPAVTQDMPSSPRARQAAAARRSARLAIIGCCLDDRESFWQWHRAAVRRSMMPCPTRGCGALPHRSIRCVTRGDGGIGDAAGIAALAEAAGERGADALALSPLHALFTAEPARFGPYSPSTRLFLNPLHASPALVFGEAHMADTLRAHTDLSDTFERLEAAAADRLATAAACQASTASGICSSCS